MCLSDYYSLYGHHLNISEIIRKANTQLLLSLYLHSEDSEPITESKARSKLEKTRIFTYAGKRAI
jgi:hypothetical protein